MDAARQTWLAAHPYLAPIARFEALVQEAAARVQPPWIEPPRWESWTEGRAEGVPLLRCSSACLRFTSAAAYVLGRVVERTAETFPPGDLADALEDIRNELHLHPEERARVIEWTIQGAPPDASWMHPGLLRFLGWTAVSRVLAPVVQALAARPGGDRWGRGSCPTCGSLPVLAHLAPAEGARRRFLVCACCRTRWRYERIGCPFCSSSAPDRLRVLELQGDDRLRIDACEDCKGYVKTYVDQGDEELFLSDWSTLHLDVLARRRGFRRIGASLYALPDGERGFPA
jgi:FdhE protein